MFKNHSFGDIKRTGGKMSDEDAMGESFFDVSELPGQDADDDDPLVGTVLDGRYRLDRLLGEGGMGRVYASTQLSVGRDVAIKLLRGEALAQQEVKERFLREAQVISGFSHPNIVRLIDYGEDTDRGFPYLVMELVRGVSLGELTRRGRLDLPLALEIAYQVCGALVQAHSEGIIHRDLKPDNLQLMPVVGDSFQTKVLDFGIAFPRDTDSRITSTGMICGTAYYIAPEQARAKQIDGRADLYALGIILYQMLSGHLPFRGDSDFQILLMQVQEPPPALSDYLPEHAVPGEVIKLVHDLLAKEPDDRPPSARAVRERIEVIRKRCAISPLRLDLETASADAFERWILPPADRAPAFDASTELDGSTPPEVRDKLDERRQTLVEDDGTDVPTDTSENQETEAADDSTSQPGDTLPSTTTTAHTTTRVVAALVVAILAAGGAALYLWQNPGKSGDGADANDAAASLADEQADDDTADPPAVNSRPTAALSAFAGRCMVIGESDTWFHTVFLYPEVGEAMFHGDERLLWSPLEIVEHDGPTLEFNYQTSDGETSVPMAVRVSSDKLIFTLDGATSTPKKSKFVCRKHDVQKYYDTLDVSGTFAQVEGRSDDSRVDAAHIKHPEVVVASSGQRITLPDGEYVYRILGGAALSEGHEVALRQAADTEANWQQATIAFDPASGVLNIMRDGDEQQYRSEEAAMRAARHAQKAAKEKAAKETARRKAAARAERPSKPEPARTERPSKPDPARSAGAGELAPHLQPASQKVFDKYDKKVREVVTRYCAVLEERSSQVEHHRKLATSGRTEEAKTYRDEVLNDTASYSMKIQSASYGYSDTLQRAYHAGLNPVQVQKLTKVWQDGCD
jgi:serine/threonine protein kinase